MKEAPSWEEYLAYWVEIFKNKDDNPYLYTEWLEDKYESWKLNGWKKEKNGKLKPIVNWKSTLRQCAPYRVKNKNTENVKQTVKPLKQTGKLKSIDDETLVDGWHYFDRNNHLLPKHEHCYQILYSRGILKNGKEKMPNGKPWQVWYDSLKKNAVGFALAQGIDKGMSNEKQKAIADGSDTDIIITYIKLEAVKYYFSKFKSAFELKQSLNK